MSDENTTATATKKKSDKSEKINGAATAGQMEAIFAQMPEEERNRMLAECKLRLTIKTAYANIVNDLALNGIEVDPEVGCLIITSEGDYIDPEDFDSGDEDDDEDDDEEFEDEDEDEEDEDEEEEDEDSYNPVAMVKALRRYMKAEGVTQMFIAKKLRVSPAAITTWFAGSSAPREKNCARIAKLVGIA